YQHEPAKAQWTLCAAIYARMNVTDCIFCKIRRSNGEEDGASFIRLPSSETSPWDQGTCAPAGPWAAQNECTRALSCRDICPILSFLRSRRLRIRSNPVSESP